MLQSTPYEFPVDEPNRSAIGVDCRGICFDDRWSKATFSALSPDIGHASGHSPLALGALATATGAG